jgi:RNA polymerase sigma-70 factor (ECF subfamily)
MNSSPLDLTGLLANVARRDRRAFAALYAATSPKLFGIVLRILKRRDIAEEVLQEVYVRVWERAADFDPARGSAIAWLATIARNRALDEARRQTAVSIEDRPDVLEVADDAEDALSQLARSEDGQRLLGCIAGLEPERRELVLLAYFQGLGREALAERFKRPVGTIKTWLHRSLAQLKKCLDT